MIKSQLLKGILQGCMLAVIHEAPTYGYEISQKLAERGLQNISEGSIYPLLLRCQKEKLIIGVMKKSDAGGPNRKYYHLTKLGEVYLEAFQQEWDKIAGPVQNILSRSEEDTCKPKK